MNVIELKNVFEKYRIKFIRDGRVSWEEIWALQDLSLNVGKGEVIGVIGPNGAGKTTLLKLISGMLMADKGTVDVRGRVAVLMELGAGFNPEFTGRENIKLNARIYGLNEEKLEQQMADIISFAGLENFIDAPIKSYSQGMFMRLAFALAIYVDPDILLIDDILAVGDQEAQEKCVKKVFEFKNAGKNIIVVSHDLNIIAKLCDRVILLEKGKVADSGLPEEVINRYLETVGNHQGIAALSWDKIRLVFNNGKIILSRAGLPVTAGMGGYVMYLAAGQNYWIPSFNLSWRIADRSPEGITAEGRDPDGAVAQIWNIGLQDNRVILHVELKDPAAKDFRFDLGMNAQYTKWLDRDAFSAFPGFTHKFNYQDLNSGAERIMSVGLSADDGRVPPVILQSGDKDTSVKLFNSGYDQEARIVQMCSANNNLLAMSLEFLTPDEFQVRVKEQEERRALEEEQERQRILLEQERAKQRRIDEAQQEIQSNILRQEEARNRRIAACTLVSGDLCFFADLESRLLRISYKDKELTGVYGLYAVFTSPGAVSNLNKVEWKFDRVSETRLKLSADFEYMSLFLEFNCAGRNTIDIKIDMEITRQTELLSRNVVLEIARKYDNWVTADESGDWSGQRYVNGILPVRLKDSMVSEVMIKPGQGEEDAPVVRFDSYSEDNTVLGVYKRVREGSENICLNYAPIILGKKHRFAPGRYEYFKGRISLGRESGFNDKRVENKLIQLDDHGLKFVFERGKSGIFLNNKEITRGLGFFTSVRYNGIWYDSYQAVWRLEEAAKDKIIVSGDWPYVPLSQTWEIRLLDPQRVAVKIKARIYEEADIEMIQCNLMLADFYKTWSAGKAGVKGDFPDEYTADYDILPFRFWYGKSRDLGAMGPDHPAVAFINMSHDDKFCGIVENTDSFQQARLLQYQRTAGAGFAPDGDFFNAEIMIGSNG